MRVLGQLVEEEGDRRRGRVVAGEHQGHHLVADLLVGEAGAVLVAGLEQQAHDVLARAVGVRAAAGDLAEDQGVELAPGGVHARPRRARPAEHLEHVVGAPEGQRLLELVRGIHAVARLVRVEAEERAHRDAQREVARPGVDVDGLARPPVGQGELGLVDHRLHRGGDPLAVEGGEHDPAGAVVVLAVDGEQPVAEQRDQVAHAAVAPAEVLGAGDGDVVVGLRADHEHDRAVEQADGEDRPEALVGLEHHRQRLVVEALRAAHREAREAGRVGHLGGALVAHVEDEAAQGAGVDLGRERRGHEDSLDQKVASFTPVAISRITIAATIRR